MGTPFGDLGSGCACRITRIRDDNRQRIGHDCSLTISGGSLPGVPTARIRRRTRRDRRPRASSRRQLKRRGPRASCTAGARAVSFPNRASTTTISLAMCPVTYTLDALAFRTETAAPVGFAPTGTPLRRFPLARSITFTVPVGVARNEQRRAVGCDRDAGGPVAAGGKRARHGLRRQIHHRNRVRRRSS